VGDEQKGGKRAEGKLRGLGSAVNTARPSRNSTGTCGRRAEKNWYPAEFSGAFLGAIALGLEKAVS